MVYYRNRTCDGHVPLCNKLDFPKAIFEGFGKSDLTPVCSKRRIYACLMQNNNKIIIDKNRRVAFL